MYSTVYELVFPDNSRYVGMTKHFNRRISQHKCKPVNDLVAEKIDKYGKDGFRCNIIEKDIHDFVAYFLELHEIHSTNDDKCLNIQGTTQNKFVVETSGKAKDIFRESFEERREKIIHHLESLLSILPNFGPMYKCGDVTNREDVINECEKYLDYLGLTVELKEAGK